MCCCASPNKNGESGYTWSSVGTDGIHPIDAPALNDGDVLLFDEPGRCRPQVNGTGSVDYHSHHFRLVKVISQFALLVQHGGGAERIMIGGSHTRLAELMDMHDSDGRYLLLHALYSAHRDARKAGEESAAARYRQAFAEGRLKKRKERGGSSVKVWIESK